MSVAIPRDGILRSSTARAPSPLENSSEYANLRLEATSLLRLPGEHVDTSTIF